jgi:hypothetical protein
MRPTFFKGVVLGAVVAAIVAGGAVAFAAVTPFNLNTTANTVSAPTGAHGTIGGNQFTFTDNSNTAGAPLALTNNSAAAGATALKLTVKAGKAPLTVNSSTKVTNLNADKLDDIDSSGLIHGKGKTYNLAVAVTRPTDPNGPASTQYDPSPAVVPGFANVSLICPATFSSNPPAVRFTSLLQSGEENVFARNDHSPDATFVPLNPFANRTQINTDSSGDLTSATINGVPGGVETTVWLQIATVRNSNNCYFQIQALTTTS